jgi:hypothetical protein
MKKFFTILQNRTNQPTGNDRRADAPLQARARGMEKPELEQLRAWFQRHQPAVKRI